jgi:phospholipid transport system substrate-binding protein
MRKLIIIVLLSFSAATPADLPPPPELMVSEALKSLAALVSDCRLPLATDPVALRGIVDHHLRPKADVLYAGQLILGRHWQDANPDQRRRFSEALYGTLVNRYATGLLLLTDSNVVVVPSGTTPDGGEAVVKLQVDAGLAAPLPILVQMRLGSGRWRVYDARWEGQSYVLSLRHEFSLAIRRDGLEAVIRRLEASAGTPAGPPEDRDTMAGRCLRARAAR